METETFFYIEMLLLIDYTYIFLVKHHKKYRYQIQEITVMINKRKHFLYEINNLSDKFEKIIDRRINIDCQI